MVDVVDERWDCGHKKRITLSQSFDDDARMEINIKIDSEDCNGCTRMILGGLDENEDIDIDMK